MTDDLGRFLAQQHSKAAATGGVTLERAQVVSWDAASGHVIKLAGTQLSEVLALASVGTPVPGQIVAVLRQRSNVLIIGVIEAPS